MRLNRKVVKLSNSYWKVVVLIFIVFSIYLLKSQFKETDVREVLRRKNLSYVKDPYSEDRTRVFVDMGGGVVEMGSLPWDNFSFVEKEDQYFDIKSDHCLVEEWNKVTTNSFTQKNLHEYWMKNNISRKDYLYHTSPSPLAAYVYDQHITVTLTAENMFGRTVFCRYFDCKRNEIPDVFESKVWPESTVRCGRRVGAKYMSVTLWRNDVPETPVPIQKRLTKGPQHYFTVCLAPLYGDEPKFIQIVDFIEHYKLQGATYFHVYLRNVSAYDRVLLDDYVRTGEVDLITLNDHYWRADYMWHTMQINDCHQRSVNFAKWTAFVDVDERIEIKGEQRIVDYLDTITNPNVANLEFNIQWVLKEDLSPAKYENDKQLLDNLIFRRFHNTSTAMNLQPKCIIRPEKVSSMDIHAPKEVYKGIKVVYVDSAIGVTRHYRNIGGGSLLNNNKRAFEVGPYSLTSLEPTYEQKLTNACLQRVKQVYDTVTYSCDEMNAMYHVHGLTHPCAVESGV